MSHNRRGSEELATREAQVPGTAEKPGSPLHRIAERHRARYLRVLWHTCSIDEWEEIVARAIVDAKKGNRAAREWLGKYMLGPPPEPPKPPAPPPPPSERSSVSLEAIAILAKKLTPGDLTRLEGGR